MGKFEGFMVLGWPYAYFFIILHVYIRRMKKTLYSRFDKKAITALPVVTFPGRIITIITAGEAEKAVDYLLSSDIMGVDTETKPAFHRGEQHKVSLLQVSNRDTCFLFRLNLTDITPAIKRLLEDTTVKKIGLSWHDDIRGLEHRQPFEPGLFIDLQDMVGDLGIKDLSLQKIYANLFHKKISKRQRLSNWEAPVLTDKQKEYAAIDAWSCIQLYEEILRLESSKDYELINVPEPENMQPAAKAQQTDAEAPEAKENDNQPKDELKPNEKNEKKVKAKSAAHHKKNKRRNAPRKQTDSHV